jgi:hypothetical protein
MACWLHGGSGIGNMGNNSCNREQACDENGRDGDGSIGDKFAAVTATSTSAWLLRRPRR